MRLFRVAHRRWTDGSSLRVGMIACFGLMAACSESPTDARAGAVRFATDPTPFQLPGITATECQWGGEYPNCKPQPTTGGDAGVAPTPSSDPAAASSGGGDGGSTPSDTTAAADSTYSVERPATCPTHISGGLVGWLLGYEYAGYRWTGEWDRREVLDMADYSRAMYVPAVYDGYAAGKGDFIESKYGGAARWYQPKLEMRCWAIDKYSGGGLEYVEEHYTVVTNLGAVVAL
jgi:hypothetical protein